jgi:stage II sporulation protein AA (anti-sigma F factor antagonist)
VVQKFLEEPSGEKPKEIIDRWKSSRFLIQVTILLWRFTVLNTKKVGDKLIVYLEGRLDVSVSNELEEELARLIDEESNNHIVLNMDKVEYMSSSGFRACISTLRKLNAKDGTLKLCNIRPSVRRIFDVIELTSLFDIYDTEAEALKA